ncbi:MAG TPA: 3-hydroxyacyl-CoA dehydrogenase family protein [Kineosporiaceae bacterium]
MPQSVAVVGAGLMGSGIAQVAAVAGHHVVLRDITPEATARGLEAVEKSLARFVAKQAITAEDAEAAVRRITTTTDLDGVADADVVIEAVYENVDVKRAVFAELDRVAKDGAVLATNTSAIPITRIAAATRRPEFVVGTHFFSPVPMMKLCEVVRGYRTSDATMAATAAFVRGLGKAVVVVSRDVAGFVANRMLLALTIEAVALLETGVASAEDIDTACRDGFGHRMGPLQTADLAGLDISLAAIDNVHAETQDPKFVAPGLLRRMVAAGDLGRKTGRGFYTY